GLTFQIIMLRHFPALALTMGLSFALYGLARKFIHYDVMTSITIETLWALPVSLLIFLFSDTGPIISANTPFFLYVMTAPVTIIPLVLFAIALNHTSLIVTGLAQYIEPSLQFLLAIMIFGEHINYAELLCFCAVWFGLFLCISENLYSHYLRARLKPVFGRVQRFFR
ncbi:EamA family transporter RarD, partial [Salmonella enterica subsp. enterica serovar 4,[5],12:d:-]|nr:EamA family transporter RarD [Salmonella enterica subsp. enterica]EGF1374087.1 EamA family transporter RarD [Salmonella enterica subsp. enterica serovar 4,[5],12:d:-]EIQ3396452.1 EamA family transporter RarD [Salmonella enterica subsp. enterica]EIU9130504.1 EamA family transporter RarD [Salmonella enterica]